MRFLTLSIPLIFSINLHAEPSVNVSTDYYIVSGKTPRDIRNSLNNNSPIYANGKRYDAHTQWSISWQYWLNGKVGDCKVNKVKTIVNVRFTLPRLQVNQFLSSTVISRWKSYESALLQHEYGHQDNGVSAAREIENRLLTIQPQQSCQTVKDMIQTITNTIISKYKQKDSIFDQQTQHGKRTGAVFP